MKGKFWLILAGIVVVAAVVLPLIPDEGGEESVPLYEVRRGPLDITVTATGTIQSRHSEVIRSQARGRNNILWVIDEGKIVTNGQLLVQFDATEIEKNYDLQEITVANSKAALSQAQEALEVAKIDKESKLSKAELNLMLAQIAFEKYEEGEYPQQLQDAESKIALAQEEVERANEALGWTRKLAEQGFVTRSDLQADELSLRQKRINLQAAVTSMNLLTNYTAREKRATLVSNVKQAERELDMAQRETRSNITKAESTVLAKDQENRKQEDMLVQLKNDIAACRITAPTNGIVIYASTMQASRRRWGAEPLKPGSQVYQRQELMYIPSSGDMIVQFNVTEADLPKLAIDKKAVITTDALPDLVAEGHLSKIGLLPDGQNAWLNPDMKVFNCEILINENPVVNGESLRAGMSCNVKMFIETHADVISVPMQCVLRIGNRPSVFLYEDGKPIAVPVEIGYDNGRFVHVISGLNAGDKVMLAPPLEAAATETPARAPEREQSETH